MHKVIFTQSFGENSAHSEKPKAPPVRDRVQVPRSRIPRWLKVSPRFGPGYQRVRSILKAHGLHSVCQEASCPNIRECFDEGTATFMILGKHCTRGCNFCDVIKAKPEGLDLDEPKRLAITVAELGLKQVVITSVTRDDLPDGGAQIFVKTMQELRERDKEVKVEFLIPDMRGNAEALGYILDSGVDVLAHNVETVGRLQKRVRGGAPKLERSLWVLNYSHKYRPRPVVKSGMMAGLGETKEEIIELMKQVCDAGADIFTIGQYLRPSPAHLPVERYYRPEEYQELARVGMEIGFGHVEAGPLVRSSYKAFNQSRELLEAR